MSATEVLRRLLDERGVEWESGLPTETIVREPNDALYVERPDGRMHVYFRSYLTPEQAIEATLGADTRPTQAESSGTLTAEKVRELMEENSRQYPSPTDPYVWLTEYDWQAIADELNATLGREITGETSDGFHTFNELYHHRAVLFSVIVRDHRELAWKSKAHHDGTMYEGMFIVGIETPQGQATYHYDVDPYWDMFECKEFDRAPEWDGHTPDESIARIATLGDADATSGRHGGTGMCHNSAPSYLDFLCSKCGFVHYHSDTNDTGDGNEWCFCPNCGAEVVDE